jgi:hypothetical protein
MEIKQFDKYYMPPKDEGMLGSGLVVVGDDGIYLLDDAGFKEQFGDNWESAKVVCIKWANAIIARSNHLHTKEDYEKYYDEIRCLAMADVDLPREQLEPVIKIICGPDQYKKMRDKYLKVLYGGSLPQPEVSVNVRTE